MHIKINNLPILYLHKQTCHCMIHMYRSWGCDAMFVRSWAY